METTMGVTKFKLLGIHFDVNLDKIEKMNYEIKIKSVKNLISLWKRRYLTPLGKVTVIKSLLLCTIVQSLIYISTKSTGYFAERD